MDDRALLLRIKVVVVSTRAALKSLDTNHGQVDDVLERGRSLLDGLEPEVIRHGSLEVRDRFAQARAELSAMFDEST